MPRESPSIIELTRNSGLANTNIHAGAKNWIPHVSAAQLDTRWRIEPSHKMHVIATICK